MRDGVSLLKDRVPIVCARWLLPLVELHLRLQQVPLLTSSFPIASTFLFFFKNPLPFAVTAELRDLHKNIRSAN